MEDGKSIREVRSFFMNADTLQNSSTYMARLDNQLRSSRPSVFNYYLSKTMKLNLDLANVTIICVPDIPCKDGDGNDTYDNRGKPLIHTDGTGFISEDLASLCPDVSQGKCLDSYIEQVCNVLCHIHDQSPVFFYFHLQPLLMQVRLFFSGSTIKGTLLVNKKLQPRTIVVRDSMVKVRPYENLSNNATANSLEIVNTSRRPKPADLSRNLIMLLSYGGVPGDFFMDLLYKALVDSRAVVFKRRAAARGSFVAKASPSSFLKEMISAGIPFEESYLKFRLPAMMDEKKKFKMGKIPLPDSYYLMGTADPTGVLKDGEVCIILDNGQVSGKVLVYRNPGLHFGDIHILNAVYVKDMEDYVGNAKFGIFFPTQGPRSLADEMAGGDYDGDMFFVSRNPELLDSFKQDDRWVPPPSIKRIKKSKKVPVEMSDQELENELFMNFWNTRFNPSSTMGIAAESWQAMMDKLLISRCDGTYKQNKEVMEKNIKRLINVYYDALDAPKSGDEVLLPIDLKVNVFPHYMEKPEKIRKCNSTSILGAIYDEVKHYEDKDEMPIAEIVKLPSFAERAPEHLLQKWTDHYKTYRFKMFKSLENEATKNDAAEGVNQQYREHFYGPTGDFHTSAKRKEELFEEARALYQVVYDYAESQRVKAGRDIAEQRKAIGKCSFAWKIAGTALCALYISSLGEKPMLCSESAWREMFG
ncbi:Probable RNA-dependent RNA polymerase 5 [Linum perenne]